MNKTLSIDEFCGKYKVLIIIILSSILLRAIFFVTLRPWDEQVLTNKILIGDASGYHELAKELLNRKAYTSPASQFRTPGYPFFLSIIYAVVGIKPWWVLLLQILLNGGAIVLVYALSRIFFSEAISLISASLYSINPLTIYYAQTILTETLFSFIFLTCMLFLFKGLSIGKIKLVFFSGLLLGLSTLVRPVTQFFLAVVVGILLIWPERKSGFRITAIIGFSLLFFITVGSWGIRNYYLYGQFGLTSFQGYNLLFDNATATKKVKTGKPYAEIRKAFSETAAQRGIEGSTPTFQNSSIYQEIALEYIFQNWKDYIPIHLRGMVLTFLDVGVIGICRYLGFDTKPLTVEFTATYGSIPKMIGAFFRIKPTSEILFSIPFYMLLIVTYAGFFIGGVSLVSEKQYLLVSIILILMIYFSLLPGVIGQARYRVPIIPFYLIICAKGFSEIVNFFKYR